MHTIRTAVLDNTLKSRRGGPGPVPPAPEFVLYFVKTDWQVADNPAFKELIAQHDLGTAYPDINIQENGVLVYVHAVEIWTTNQVRLYVPAGDEFEGILIIRS